MAMARNLVATLRRRALFSAATSEELEFVLAPGQQPSAYVGLDPTAASLHVGNLVTLRAMMHVQRAGFKPLIVVGGATGLIGDPSGRTTERSLLDSQTVAEHSKGIVKCLHQVLDFSNPATAPLVLNNREFYDSMSVYSFVRDVGRHFRINSMLARDSVKSRLDSGAGLSFTEFSYQLFQAYDFLCLYQQQHCVLQLGGSDQWGNITAGIDLIRRVTNQQVHGITVPLLTTASGEKFGKSAGNAVWLDPELTSHYAFYQFFLKAEDADVHKLLLIFTDLSEEEVDEVMKTHNVLPDNRTAQRALAAHVTRDVRGADGLKAAERVSQLLFGGEMGSVTAKELIGLCGEVECAKLPSSSLVGAKVVDVFHKAGMCSSKAEARRTIEAGGAYINNQRVASPQDTMAADQLIEGKACLLRTGKRKYMVVQAE